MSYLIGRCWGEISYSIAFYLSSNGILTSLLSKAASLLAERMLTLARLISEALLLTWSLRFSLLFDPTIRGGLFGHLI